MEAKETVMNKGQIQEAIIQGRADLPAYGSGSAEHWQAEYKAVAQAQAEISFKAGEHKQKLICSQCPNAGSCLNTEGCLEEIESGLEAIKKAGIREVVEWLEGEFVKATGDLVKPYRFINEDGWQAKLKEWGIE